MEKQISDYFDQLECGKISQDKGTGKVVINTDGEELYANLEGEIFSGETFLRSSLSFDDYSLSLAVYSSISAADPSILPAGLTYETAIKDDLTDFAAQLKRDAIYMQEYIDLIPYKEKFKTKYSARVYENRYLDRDFIFTYTYRA